MTTNPFLSPHLKPMITFNVSKYIFENVKFPLWMTKT